MFVRFQKADLEDKVAELICTLLPGMTPFSQDVAKSWLDTTLKEIGWGDDSSRMEGAV